MSEDESDGWAETPRGERSQFHVFETVRDYLRVRADEENVTYSTLLERMIPEEYEEIEVTDERVSLKPTKEVGSKIRNMTGEKENPRDVVALLALVDATREGRVEIASEIATLIPSEIFAALEVEFDE